MNRFRTAAAGLGIILIALVSAPALAAVYTATVAGGFGTGHYPSGAEVFIESFPYDDADPSRATREPADPEAPEAIFCHWTGDTESVVDIHSARTALIMPPRDIMLTAVYKEAPRWTGPTVIAEIPPNHVAVIFFFHGRGGGAYTAFVQAESISFIQDALSRGIGVVALDSYDRVEKAWHESPDPGQNIDLQRTAALRRALIADGRMSADDPVYVVGASNGGLVASLFDDDVQDALDFPVDAAALYISSGDLTVMQTTNVPTVFALAENDGATDPAITAFNSLVVRGVPTQLWINPSRPLHPGSFWRIGGLNLADSEAIYSALSEAGIVDGDGYVTSNPKNDSRWQAFIPATYSAYLQPIEDQLKIGYGEHGFMSDFNVRILDFLESPTSLQTLAPTVSDFDPQSGPPGTSVNVNGDGFIAITSVTVGGVPTTFATASSTQLRVTIPAGAASGPITVSNNVGSSTSTNHFLVDGPSISGFLPASGPPGTLVTVNGTGFVDVTNVAIGGVSAEIVAAYAKTLTIQVPVGAVGGPISVTNAVATGVSQAQFSVSGPHVSGISPASGTPGDRVTISGSGFAEVTAVTFSGVSAEIIYVSPTSLQVRVPEGAQTGLVTVTNYIGAASSPVNFQVLLPQIQSFSPASGPVGTRVNIFGSGFSGLVSVQFNGVSAEVLYASPTGVKVRVPAGATTGPISVRAATGTGMSGTNFSVN